MQSSNLLKFDSTTINLGTINHYHANHDNVVFRFKNISKEVFTLEIILLFGMIVGSLIGLVKPYYLKLKHPVGSSFTL